jgi:RNA polymerase sigma-70 factor, ECF subfamily
MTGTGDPPREAAARAALVRLLRDEGRRVLATLVRHTGDLQIAEDAVQDAVLRALDTWPRTGVPAQPRAWLTLTARNRAVDLVRRESVRTGKEAEAVALLDSFGPGPPADEPPEVLRDDLLRLVFTCCHPTLALDTQVALALHTLCGLSTAEVGRALLVPDATMAKRLTRAKQKIARAGIPYRVPDAAELPARLRGVTATVYLLFSEGYTRPDGGPTADEAVRLARLLQELMPDEPSVLGLLALVLLQDSRRAARFADGHPVLLADQDRSRWRRAAVGEGVVLVGEGLRRTPVRPDPYVVQAAIAACHALAPSAADTDWAAVLSWYDVLLTVLDTPVVRLNRAVALSELHGPAAALAELDALAALRGYPLWHATRAELLVRLDRVAEARAAFDAALALPLNDAQRLHVAGRRAALQR